MFVALSKSSLVVDYVMFARTVIIFARTHVRLGGVEWVREMIHEQPLGIGNQPRKCVWCVLEELCRKRFTPTSFHAEERRVLRVQK
jgi:hypothetical protein